MTVRKKARNDRIIDAVCRRGLPLTEVAQAHGISIPRASQIINRDAGRRYLTLELPDDVLFALQTAAAERGVQTRTVARALLVTVAKDGLFDAVLDQGAA